ncbi:hypothetical protein [Thiolapillus sp.]|uniref:hypothetical protein n=1 Tax=Thiolapillus sp. TaxID=2017437 RepID=UPI003AF802FE
MKRIETTAQEINIQIRTTPQFVKFCDYMNQLSTSGIIDPEQAGQLINLWRICAEKYISIDL